MQTLEILDKKIGTAEDLLGVVNNMKSLAAVNIRQLFGAPDGHAGGGKKYFGTGRQLAEVVQRAAPDGHHQ